jgi:hypothetical protein
VLLHIQFGCLERLIDPPDVRETGILKFTIHIGWDPNKTNGLFLVVRCPVKVQQT